MLNKKCQGLPINFIIIAALAVIVLVLVALFLFGGFRTEAVDTQSAANSCAAKCLSLQRKYVNSGSTSFVDDLGYCNELDIKGLGKTDCSALSPCDIDFGDKLCAIKCNSGMASTACS